MSDDAPTELQLDLFRAVEDVHELTSALVVLLVDADGQSVAVSGDERVVPEKLRAVLGGKRLAAAGSVRELLTDVPMDDVEGAPVNVSVFDVDGSHLLAIVFDSDADLETVQTLGSAAKVTIADRFAGKDS